MKTKQTSPASILHMRALESLATNLRHNPGEKIYQNLRRIEKRLAYHTEAACNTQVGADYLPTAIQIYTEQVREVLGTLPTGFFINTDPRGYALKLDNDKVPAAIEGLHRDMGGYYILAPEF